MTNGNFFCCCRFYSNRLNLLRLCATLKSNITKWNFPIGILKQFGPTWQKCPIIFLSKITPPSWTRDGVGTTNFWLGFSGRKNKEKIIYSIRETSIQCSTETSEPPSPTNRWANHTVQHRDQWATLTHQQVGYSYSAAHRPMNHPHPPTSGLLIQCSTETSEPPPHPPTGGVLITYIDQQSTLFLLVSRRHPLTGGAIWPNNDNHTNRPTKHSLSLLLSRPTFPQNEKMVIL